VSPLSADDQPAATLAEIRERDKRVWNLRGNVGGLLAINEAKDDVPRLVAALEAADAALKRHMQWFGSMGDRLCGGCLRPVPCPDTNVIAAALAKGGGGTDG
jgi:hypothetical protein